MFSSFLPFLIHLLPFFVQILSLDPHALIVLIRTSRQPIWQAKFQARLLQTIRTASSSISTSLTGGGDSSFSPTCKGKPLDPAHGLGLASPLTAAEGSWKDVGGGEGEEKEEAEKGNNMYAHIPSRLHCPTTGSVHGM